MLHAVSVPLRHAGALLTKTISAKSGIKTTEENGDSIPILEVSDWKYLFLRIAVDTGQVHAYEYRIEVHYEIKKKWEENIVCFVYVFSLSCLLLL